MHGMCLTLALAFSLFGIAVAIAATPEKHQTDVLQTSAGDLKITFLGHGSLIFAFGGKIFQIDPYGQVADYAKLPQADVVLITHEHFDHFDQKALGQVRTKETQVVVNAAGAAQVQGGIVMRNGETRTFGDVKVEAVPAYNLVHRRDNGQPFHPQGVGNGYVLTFGDKRVYVAGDTENTPEMKSLRGIDCAFLPMNLPYTMTPEMVADAAKIFTPKVLYPYHYGETDPLTLTALLKNNPEIEVRIRTMK